MPGPFDYAVWLICCLLEAAVLVCAFRTNSFRRYLALNLYMGSEFLISIPRLWTLVHYGFRSLQYRYVYYYSDAVVTIILYFAILHLFSHVFDEMGAERYLRYGATLLLGGTALFSYLIVQQSGSRLFTRFVFEMSQNLYFVGMVLTYVLWGAAFKLRETRTRLIQLILSLGVYFSAFTANYALRNLHHDLYGLLPYLTPVIGIWLPAAWMYTFLRTPEEARMVPARLAVMHR